MNLDQLAELVQAAKAGKALQMHWNDDRGWVDVPPDRFMVNFRSFPDNDWRIKPEPREWWVNDYLGDENLGADGTRWHPTRNEADKYAERDRKRLLRLKEIEVIEFP